MTGFGSRRGTTAVTSEEGGLGGGSTSLGGLWALSTESRSVRACTSERGGFRAASTEGGSTSSVASEGRGFWACTSERGGFRTAQCASRTSWGSTFLLNSRASTSCFGGLVERRRHASSLKSRATESSLGSRETTVGHTNSLAVGAASRTLVTAFGARRHFWALKTGIRTTWALSLGGRTIGDIRTGWASRTSS